MKSKNIIIYLLLAVSFLMFSGIFSTIFAAPDYIYSANAIKRRIVKEAINQGIDPALALSIAKQESNFKKDARSYVGAIGLFQLMPQTADHLGVNPYYINQNIKGGISYVKMMKEQFGSTKLALAAYNAGPGAVSKYGGIPPYRETQHYVKNIMSYYNHYQKNPDPILVEMYLNPKKDDSTIIANENNNENTEDQKNKRELAIEFFSRIFEIIT